MNDELQMISDRLEIAVAGFCEALEDAANEFRRTAVLMNKMNSCLQESVAGLRDDDDDSSNQKGAGG